MKNNLTVMLSANFLYKLQHLNSTVAPFVSLINNWLQCNILNVKKYCRIFYKHEAAERNAVKCFGREANYIYM